MSDTPEPAARPSSPEHPTGRNIPNEIEKLQADVAALTAWRTDMEARIDQLGGN